MSAAYTSWLSYCVSSDRACYSVVGIPLSNTEVILPTARKSCAIIGVAWWVSLTGG